MYKNSIFTLALGTFYLLFTASTCEVPIELDDHPEPKLVLLSEFTVDKPVEVTLSRSRSVLDDPLSPEKSFPHDAIVEIWEGSNFIEPLHFDNSTPEEPKYISDSSPEIGVFYTIKAEVPGFDRISATNHIPAPGNTTHFDITDTNNYYDKSNSKTPYVYAYDLFLEIEQSSNDEDKFYYIKFEYGAQVFQSIQVKTFELKSKDSNNPRYIENHYDEGILIDAGNWQGNLRLNFEATARLASENQLIKELYVELRSISKDYFDFHSSASDQIQHSDLHPFLNSTSPLYTNIENGYGYFAGYSAAKDTIPAN